MYLDRNFGLRLSLSESLSSNLQSLDLVKSVKSVKSIYFFDSSLDLDRTSAQRSEKG